MKTILVSILCVSIISVAGAEQNKNKKKGGQQGGGGPAGHPQTQHVTSGKLHTVNPSLQTHHKLPAIQKTTNVTNKHITNKNISKTNITNKTVNKTNITNNKFQHFKLGNKPNRNFPAAKFQAGVHIHNSQMWVGPRYVVFRNYVPIWHTQAWWIGHHSNFVFVFGAPYYWNAGYWYPAWGYYPGATYYYEGPIYASSPSVTPEDMVANVQSALQQQTGADGEPYYQGEIDGVLGPQTRAAIASYQQDHGLYATSAIDEPTLESLGLA